VTYIIELKRRKKATAAARRLTAIDEVVRLQVVAVHRHQLLGRAKLHWQLHMLPVAPHLELHGQENGTAEN
jgi:hypothetical protein